MTLHIKDFHFTYPGWPPTLRGVTLEVPSGKSAFLLGPSGIGKSTLLRCIAGLQSGYTGSVQLDGRPVDDLPTHKRRIGFVTQEPALFPHLDVAHNVAFGLRYRGVPRSGEPAEVQHWLELVGLADRGRSRVDELSGGQRQRVALARTLAAKPEAVLLDEPFSGLDRELRQELGIKVKGLLAEQGVPALWVTHDEEEAFQLGDSVWRLQEGCVVAAERR
jgi:ABC-type Fe3+/spermidine/putrescine transport system ATPase subunit